MIKLRPQLAPAILTAATLLLTTPAIQAKFFKMAIGEAQGGTQYALGEIFA